MLFPNNYNQNYKFHNAVLLYAKGLFVATLTIDLDRKNQCIQSLVDNPM